MITLWRQCNIGFKSTWQNVSCILFSQRMEQDLDLQETQEIWKSRFYSEFLLSLKSSESNSTLLILQFFLILRNWAMWNSQMSFIGEFIKTEQHKRLSQTYWTILHIVKSKNIYLKMNSSDCYKQPEPDLGNTVYLIISSSPITLVEDQL